MKIAFFEVKPWEESGIKRLAKKLGADFYRQKLQEALPLAKKYQIISTFIYSDCSAKTLNQLPRLRLLVTRSVGMDHIDLEYCRQKGIVVKNIPDYGARTVAEHTFGLILAVAKNLIPAVDRVRQGGFSPVGLTGIELWGKTLGVIGVGRIGRQVVRIAKGFGMRVLGVTRSPHPELERRLGYQRVALSECLSQADIVTLHVPLTRQTFHLINRQNIVLMKHGSFLINTSRGPVVETEALLWGLREGILAGVGLDVLEEEEKIPDPTVLFAKHLSRDDLAELVAAHLLREDPRVVITPHTAFNTKEAIHRIIQKTALHIQEFLAQNYSPGAGAKVDKQKGRP